MSQHDINIQVSQQIAELTRRVAELEAYRSSLESDRTPTYTSSVTTEPVHSLPGRDSVRQPNETESSLNKKTLGVAEISEVATQALSVNYSKRPSDIFGFSPPISFVCILLVYYRIYSDDGAIPSKSPVDHDDPFLGRIKARSVPPPRNVKAVKRIIENVENIKHRERTRLFLTPYSKSALDDADKITMLNGTGPGSKPQEALAFVSKMSDSERTALESDGRGLASTEKPRPDIRHGMSIQHSRSTFHFVTSCVGGSVLCGLRRRFSNPIERSL